MGIDQLLGGSLLNQSLSQPLSDYLISLGLTALLCTVIAAMYVRCGQSLSNRRRFSRLFVILGVTTAMIITVVKSSLALSLGLVGALSIIRFRTAIKDPEELAYVFLCIGIGLGLGANQYLIVVIGFLAACLIIYVQYRRGVTDDINNLLLSVSSDSSDDVNLELISATLLKHCSKITLKRFDESLDRVEAVFVIGIDNFEDLSNCKNDLKALAKSMTVSFFDNKAVV